VRVFVDTNVLFPFSVTDLMLALTEDSVHEIVWSERLLLEWERVIVREQRRSAESAAAVTRAIRRFFADCEIPESAYAHLVLQMPGDDPMTATTRPPPWLPVQACSSPGISTTFPSRHWRSTVYGFSARTTTCVNSTMSCLARSATWCGSGAGELALPVVQDGGPSNGHDGEEARRRESAASRPGRR
jgi:hypothetical protein